MPSNANEAEIVLRSIARLRAGIISIVMGILSGMALLVATVWLLIRGGATVGPHLSLLGNFFPGYSVTWGGALIGFFWGAVAGALVGWVTAWVYNWVAGHRLTRPR